MTVQARLEAFQASHKPSRPASSVWVPPAREMLPYNAEIIAADQTLNACGLVHISVLKGWPIVRWARDLKGRAPDEMTGTHRSLTQANDLYALLVEMFWAARVQAESFERLPKLVHEAVPPSTPRIKRPESAMLAAASFRNAATSQGLWLLDPVEPRSHAKLMTGNAEAKKPERRKAFPGVADAIGLDTTDLTNEHKRDAASVAIYALIQNAEVWTSG